VIKCRNTNRKRGSPGGTRHPRYGTSRGRFPIGVSSALPLVTLPLHPERHPPGDYTPDRRAEDGRDHTNQGNDERAIHRANGIRAAGRTTRR
jgi:hypothetical protein